MNRATFIEKLTEVQRTMGELLAQLQATEQDKFAAHLYHSRRQYRLAGTASATGRGARRTCRPRLECLDDRLAGAMEVGLT